MRLKFLSLNKLVDAAYLCGIDKTPVSLLIAAPPGSGKTWSTSAIADLDFVLYLNQAFSPNEHRKVIIKTAARTRLLINDDLGLAARWNIEQYYGTFSMIHDGALSFIQCGSVQEALMYCSMILCCTTDHYHQHYDSMRGCGLYDRLIPVVVGLSQETRKEYQNYRKQTSLHNNRAPNRSAVIIDPHLPQVDLIAEKDVDPRLFNNLMRISQYLSEDEMIELIEVTQSSKRYEI